MARRTAATTERDSGTVDVAEVRAHSRPGRYEAHGYAALLGLRVYEPLRLYAQVRRGLSYSAFEHLQRNAEMTARELAEMVDIPPRTLARRKESGRLEPDESDRLLRTARVFGRAVELFEGDIGGARHWLSSEQRALGGVVPFDLLRTDIGAREVEQVIGRLEHGIPT